MSRVIFFVIATFAIFIKLSLSSELYKYNEIYRALKANGSNSSFDILDGNCTNVSETYAVLHDHVRKSAVPFISRNATSSWYGDKQIFCLMVENLKYPSNESVAFVKEGGVNHSYVTIEMHSSSGYGFEYYVYAYAS